MTKESDEQLLERFRRNDQQAFSQLVHRYEKELYNFLAKFMGNSASAEEVFQETFLQVYLSIEQFDTSRSFRPWLYAIAANKARDWFRKKSRHPETQITTDESTGELNLWNHLLQDNYTPDKLLEEKELKNKIQEIIASMPSNFRQILTLAYFKRFSYKEMAEILNIPLGTVKSRLHAAVENFAQTYTHYD